MNVKDWLAEIRKLTSTPTNKHTVDQRVKALTKLCPGPVECDLPESGDKINIRVVAKGNGDSTGPKFLAPYLKFTPADNPFGYVHFDELSAADLKWIAALREPFELWVCDRGPFPDYHVMLKGTL